MLDFTKIVDKRGVLDFTSICSSDKREILDFTSNSRLDKISSGNSQELSSEMLGQSNPPDKFDASSRVTSCGGGDGLSSTNSREDLADGASNLQISPIPLRATIDPPDLFNTNKVFAPSEISADSIEIDETKSNTNINDMKQEDEKNDCSIVVGHNRYLKDVWCYNSL